jgi:hydroxyacylglutathione hydrolase
LSDNDVIDIAEPHIQLAVLDVPGHTAGHIAYVVHEQGWLFCGDTLFAGGCGRLFEGTPEQMTRSLAKLAALPDETKVYCAHEYTVSNLRFAVAAEPGNSAIAERLQQAQAAREQGLATVPSTIGLEKLTNPFLRYREPGIADTLSAQGRLSIQPGEHGSNKPDASVASFAALREWKNTFR